MGIYLNPNNSNFKETISAEIYVDKSMMIKEINRLMDTGNKYICVSRPRRFGKTIATNMLSAYYSKGCDSRELFSELKISEDPRFEETINRYNVIIVDLNSEFQNTLDREHLLEILSGRIKKEMRREFPEADIRDEYTLAESILEVYSSTGERFMIFIDEYDVLVREEVSDELFQKYLSFLNGLFKSNTLRQAISLAYITGILPVVRDRIQSKLNNFEEYTILDALSLAEYVGFTSKEVMDLCDKYDMDYEECKRWYDGYSQHGYEIYNPQSVVKALTSKKCKGYWNLTSTYRVIAERLQDNFAGTKDDVIRMLSGESVDVRVTTYMNTMKDFATRDDVFTYLIHIGYLAYNEDDETCRIPNHEIWQEWESAVSVVDEYAQTNEIIRASKELLQSTISGDEEAVAHALDISHIHVTNNRSYNNEDALQSAIYLAYLYALNKYTVVKEMTAGKGFSDVTFIPFEKGYPAMIIELKRNASTKSAIDQIREKRYYDSLSHYQGKLLFVGINYDEKAKTHECSIERFEK